MDEIRPFSVDRGAVFKTLLLSPSSGWPVWATLAAGLIVTAVGASADPRCVMLGLMICVAVTPGLAAFVYFSHTLDPEMVPNLLPHTLERVEGGFRLCLWRHRDEDESTDDTPEETPGGWIRTGMISLSDEKITGRKTSFEYEVFYFKESPMKILYVPRF